MMPNKKYIVRLSDEEREVLMDVVRRLKGTSQKVRRANILLKADADGPNWTDAEIGEAFFCSVRSIEKLRMKLVTEGFDAALNRKKRETPPAPARLDGEQQAQVIALRLSSPPEGFGRWSLRLLADRIVELGIVESISHETVRKVIKKTG